MTARAISVLTMAGSVYVAYQVQQYDPEGRQVVVLSAAGGLALSLLLQSFAGRFSRKEEPLTKQIIQVLTWDLTSFVGSVVLPCTVVYCTLKRNSEWIDKYTFGMIQLDPIMRFRGRDVTHFYPPLAGLNVGLLAGHMIGNFITHFVKRD